MDIVECVRESIWSWVMVHGRGVLYVFKISYKGTRTRPIDVFFVFLLLTFWLLRRVVTRIEVIVYLLTVS